MSGSDAIVFHELVARVEALEAVSQILRDTVLRLQERLEGKDMMSDLKMPPETPAMTSGLGMPEKKGRDAA